MSVQINLRFLKKLAFALLLYGTCQLVSAQTVSNCVITYSPSNPIAADQTLTISMRCNNGTISTPNNFRLVASGLQTSNQFGFENIPYTVNLKTANIAAGTYDLTVLECGTTGTNTPQVGCPSSVPLVIGAVATGSVTVTASSGGGGGTTNAPPTVSLTSPVNGSVISAPATISIAATASDSDGSIQRVEFYNGSTLLGTSTSAPYTFTWTNVPSGSYVITARAFDNLGAPATSQAATVIANAPPTIRVLTPTTGATFTAQATINMTAEASDPDGTIQRVDYYDSNGNRLIGSATTAPYSVNWSNLPAGDYVFFAQAIDDRGVSTASQASFRVLASPVNNPPTVSLTAPSNGATFVAPATITLNATASDSDGNVARVEFYNGTALLGTSTSAPYTFTWTNVSAGSYVITARAFDNLGAQTNSNSVSVGVSVTNILPSVSITSPASNASFVAPATINLQATANDSDGQVLRVEFFSGTTLLGTATSAPYTFNWTNVSGGTYSITARAIDNQNGSTTSSAVTVSVRTSTPTISCGVETTPGKIKLTEGVTFRAVCSRNGTPLAAANGETLTYRWTPGSQSPAIPAGAARAETLVLPAGTFKQAGTFDYRVVATLTGTQFLGTATSNEAAGQVQVERGVNKIEIVTPPGGLRITPGVELSVTVKALDDQGVGIPGIVASWRIDNGNAKSKNTTSGKKSGKATACPEFDTPNSGPLPATNDVGTTTLKFTPSCASGGRSISVTAGSITQSFLLSGPDQLANSLRLMGNETVVVLEADKLSTIPVIVEETNGGAKVASATTTWTIIPSQAGVATSPAISNQNGEARSTVVLRSGYSAATARVCIEGRSSVCIDIPIRSAQAAVGAPAQAAVQPMARQSIDSPRVQLQNIRNRLQQLRVEESTGKGDSDSSSGKDEGSGASAGRARVSGLSFFMLGDIEVAKRDPSDADRGYTLRSKGITAGADYRLSKKVVLGLAAGVQRGNTSAGEGGDQKSKGLSASLFAQWIPNKNWYGNVIANLGRNTYNNTRTGLSGDTLSARVTSAQQGLQFEGGYALIKDTTRFTPFLRYQFIRAKLNPYEESGGTDAVAVNAYTLRANTFGVGVTAERAFSTRNGVWIPSARVEYVTESQKQGEIYARLVNGTPVLVPIDAGMLDKSYGTTSLNLQWLTGAGGNLTSSFIGYEQTFGKTAYKSERFTAGVKIPF